MSSGAYVQINWKRKGRQALFFQGGEGVGRGRESMRDLWGR